MKQFDRYHELLGIPPEEQPANHYRLLGLAAFEPRRSVIENGAARQMRYVRDLAHGPYSSDSQELLNELAEAKLCLLRPDSKATYDRQLQDQFADGPASSTPPALANCPESNKTLPMSSGRSPRPATDRPAPDADLVPRDWTIGSDPGCSVVVEAATVSRLHCKLTLRKGRVYLQDLNSTNGTYVNGIRRRKRQRVSVTDVITLGRRIALPWPAELLRSQRSDAAGS